MPDILVCDAIAREGLEILQRAARVTINDKITGAELLAIIPSFDGLIVRSRTKVTAPVIEAGARLRVIGRAGVGLDNIDVEAAKRCGVAVVNSPNSAMISVAEHTIGLMLAIARFIPQADLSLRQGTWEKSRFMGVELYGKTLGIIGLGRIGTHVAKRAAAFVMRVLAYDPYVTPAAVQACGATPCASLDDVLTQSDFISIHTPLLSTTRGMIGAEQIAKMKPNVRVILCARGGVVDEAALLEALDSGRIAGAALDVFENEPPGDHPLCKHPRVVVTPHIASMTEEGQTRAAIDIAEQVAAILGRT